MIHPEDLKSIRSHVRHRIPVVTLLLWFPPNMDDWIGTDRFGVIFQGLLSSTIVLQYSLDMTKA